MRAPSIELVHEIEQFLYREARLLDAEQYDEWLLMLTDDIYYFMPANMNYFRRDSSIDPAVKRVALYEEDLASIKRRIKRFHTGQAWAEDPPTRHCHVITNIQVELTDNADEYRVYSAFVNHRSRNEQDEDLMLGRREDLLRRVNGELKLARRKITTTQSTILAKNLSAYL